MEANQAGEIQVVEWSEQLRSVTSVWLGPAAAAFKSDSAPAGVRARTLKVWCYISPRDLLPSKIIIIMMIIIILQKGEQRGHIIIKTTHTLPHMHNHTCSQQRILLREINKQFDWHD